MTRVNLTKKDLINSIYMQIGFSKNISENLIDDFLSTIVENLKNEKKLKLSKFGTFSIRSKKSRIGRNPKTKEQKTISDRDVVLFKALNRTTSLSDIVFCSLVLGFLPILLFFERIENVPNFDNFSFFSFFKFSTIVLKKSSIRFSDIFLEKPICI
jgi:integration host factor subunit alpha